MNYSIESATLKELYYFFLFFDEWTTIIDNISYCFLCPQILFFNSRKHFSGQGAGCSNYICANKLFMI